MNCRITLIFCACSLAVLAGEHLLFASYPNIVYILADDMGYGDVSILNEKSKIPTPHIDSLGREGIRFTDAHAVCSVCTPSRYGILTGRYPMRTAYKSRVINGYEPLILEENRLTVPQMLREKGYNTAIFGKWHLGVNWSTKEGISLERSLQNSDDRAQQIDFTKTITAGPLTVGFDRFFGISASLDMAPYVFIENDRVTELPTAIKQNDPPRPGLAGEKFEPVDMLPIITQKGVDYIKAHAAGTSAKPFFLYLPLNAPHTPLVPTEQWKGKNSLGDYGDFCMQVDDSVGQILNALKQNGLDENTSVFYTSDNGFAPYLKPEKYESQGHYPSYIYRGYKGQVYEGGHRIPLFIRWTGTIKPNSVCDHLVSLIDLMRTCADIVEYPLPDNAAEDSISMVPLFAGQFSIASRREHVSISPDNRATFRQNNWKLVVSAHTRQQPVGAGLKTICELYNMDADPSEKRYVAAENKELVASLIRDFQKTIDRGRSTPGTPQKNDSDFRLLVP
jgi:arylsulfatase A-like enzyme